MYDSGQKNWTYIGDENSVDQRERDVKRLEKVGGEPVGVGALWCRQARARTPIGRRLAVISSPIVIAGASLPAVTLALPFAFRLTVSLMDSTKNVKFFNSKTLSSQSLGRVC